MGDGAPAWVLIGVAEFFEEEAKVVAFEAGAKVTAQQPCRSARSTVYIEGAAGRLERVFRLAGIEEESGRMGGGVGGTAALRAVGFFEPSSRCAFRV